MVSRNSSSLVTACTKPFYYRWPLFGNTRIFWTVLEYTFCDAAFLWPTTELDITVAEVRDYLSAYFPMDPFLKELTYALESIVGGSNYFLRNLNNEMAKGLESLHVSEDDDWLGCCNDEVIKNELAAEFISCIRLKLMYH